MKSRDATLRLKKFDVAEKARRVADFETMVRDFEVIVVDLERQIKTEEERTGVRDASHYAYSTFAKAAALRRENLLLSVTDVRAKLDDGRRAYEAALDELRLVEAAEPPREVVSSDRSRRNGRSDRNSVAVG